LVTSDDQSIKWQRWLEGPERRNIDNADVSDQAIAGVSNQDRWAAKSEGVKEMAEEPVGL
jgi:hypothetical protein